MINSLEYDDIRNSIVNFLKQDPYYKDFNFEASNMSRIINLLAYTSMYNGYYIKMMLDESLPDSAKTMTAMVAHANNRNYVSKFISSSKSLISVTVNGTNINRDNVPYIQIIRGQSFKGVDRNGKTIYFINPYDATLQYDTDTGLFSGDQVLLVQGEYKVVSYNVDQLNQKYMINDPQCDENSIEVRIKTNKGSALSTEYLRNYDFYDTEPLDFKYYITASTSGLYQVHFGRDSFGREPKLNEYIEITYIKTSGSVANDTNKFGLVLSKKVDTKQTDINFYANNLVTVSTVESSSGGLDAESIDELRYSVLNNSRQRGRAVTPEDIKSIIISEFRDVESINVWSGGTSTVRRYGKTYISIKPKTGELLTNTSKKIITNILVSRFGVISSTDLIFVDPDFTDILMRVKYKINRAVTSDNTSNVKSNIETAVIQFNTDFLSKFDSTYYNVDLINYVKSNVPTLLSMYVEKILQKVIDLNYRSGQIELNFANPIKNIYSNDFVYGNNAASLTSDINGNIFIKISTDVKNPIKIGTVDLNTGKVIINIPQYVNSKVINVLATPVYDDIDTSEDNIIRIKSVFAEEMIKMGNI